MCKPKMPKPPPVVVRDPVKEAADAANEAAGKANQEMAAKRKRRRESSLLTVGAQGSPTGANSLLTMARPGA
jgi:hypothetical protein